MNSDSDDSSALFGGRLYLRIGRLAVRLSGLALPNTTHLSHQASLARLTAAIYTSGLWELPLFVILHCWHEFLGLSLLTVRPKYTPLRPTPRPPIFFSTECLIMSCDLASILAEAHFSKKNTWSSAVFIFHPVSSNFKEVKNTLGLFYLWFIEVLSPVFTVHGRISAGTDPTNLEITGHGRLITARDLSARLGETAVTVHGTVGTTWQPTGSPKIFTISASDHAEKVETPILKAINNLSPSFAQAAASKISWVSSGRRAALDRIFTSWRTHWAHPSRICNRMPTMSGSLFMMHWQWQKKLKKKEMLLLRHANTKPQWIYIPKL